MIEFKIYFQGGFNTPFGGANAGMGAGAGAGGGAGSNGQSGNGGPGGRGGSPPMQ